MQIKRTQKFGKESRFIYGLERVTWKIIRSQRISANGNTGILEYTDSDNILLQVSASDIQCV